MRVSKFELGLITVAVITVVAVVIYLLPAKQPVAGTESADSGALAVTVKGDKKNVFPAGATAAAQETGKKAKKKKGWFAKEGEAAAAPAVEAPPPLTPKQLAAAKAVGDWETLVDKLAELKDIPTKERMDEVKEAFDKLDTKDQEDAVHRALNLLPDEQFPALFGILFDKRENAEILDAIFSDALNRPEELKVPLMKELVLDKEHPMFFESARILDVTGELDKMSGNAKPDEADEADGETMVEETVTPTPAAP